MKDQLLNIFNSPEFKNRLTSININYPNLKQENVIRNTILEILNLEFESSNPQLRAFAEHPRENNSRVDLSIVNKRDLLNPILIELKFQYTNDYNQFTEFKHIVERDFQRLVYKKQTDIFILIISWWDKENKMKFDKEWGLTTNLSRYLSMDENWINNINKLLSEYSNTEVNEVKIQLLKPYLTNYQIQILTRGKPAADK
jgi:predicted amidophosphoribosyltransferase